MCIYYNVKQTQTCIHTQYFVIGKYVQGLQKTFQDELAAASTTAEESIGNLRTVRSFSQEKKSMRLYGVDIDKSFKIGAKLALSAGM